MTSTAKALLAAIALPVSALAAWTALNVVDETLTPEAIALIESAKALPGPIDESNAVVWMAALTAPRREDPLEYGKKRLTAMLAGTGVDNRAPELRIPPEAQCRPEESRCFPIDGAQAETLLNAQEHAAEAMALAARMREAPVFVEVAGRTTSAVPVTDARGLAYAQELDFATVRLAAAAGEWEAAIATLEATAAFNRKALAAWKTLIPKLITANAVARDALLAVQLWQQYGQSLGAFQPRLVALAAPLTPADLSLAHAAARDVAGTASQIAGGGRDSLALLAGVEPDLKGRIEMIFYLPNATVNAIAARANQFGPALTGVTRDFDEARKAVPRIGSDASNPNVEWHLALRNATGKVLIDAIGANDYTEYQASMHDAQALLALARARLSAPSTATEADWAVTLGDPRWIDPYTGEKLKIAAGLSQPAIAARRRDATWLKAMLGSTQGRLVAQSQLQ